MKSTSPGKGRSLRGRRLVVEIVPGVGGLLASTGLSEASEARPGDSSSYQSVDKVYDGWWAPTL